MPSLPSGRFETVQGLRIVPGSMALLEEAPKSPLVVHARSCGAHERAHTHTKSGVSLANSGIPQSFVCGLHSTVADRSMPLRCQAMTL